MITIRKATEEDIEADLGKLYIDLYKYHQNLRPDIFIDRSDKKLIDYLRYLMKNMNVYVATDDGIVGFVIFQCVKKIDNILWIDQITVDETRRNQGIARKLMNFVYAKAKEEHCKRIELNCYTNNTLGNITYSKLGFEKQKIVYEMKVENQ